MQWLAVYHADMHRKIKIFNGTTEEGRLEEK